MRTILHWPQGMTIIVIKIYQSIIFKFRHVIVFLLYFGKRAFSLGYKCLWRRDYLRIWLCVGNGKDILSFEIGNKVSPSLRLIGKIIFKLGVLRLEKHSDLISLLLL